MLPNNGHAFAHQQPTKTVVINSFQETWPELAMNFDCGANDTLRKVPVNVFHNNKFFAVTASCGIAY